MRLVFLASTGPDLAWFRTYYCTVFTEGAAAAHRHFAKAIDNLADSPYIGRSIGLEDIRKLSVPKTPFAVFYQVVEDRIEIIRIWDQRADPELLEFHEEAAVLT